MPLDAFKNLNEVFKPDLEKNITLEEFHNELVQINLIKKAPEGIKIQFDIVKNLMLYSWFVRRFKHVADLHAFTTIEYAIRTKIELVTHKKCELKNLRPLLEYAMNEKWIVDTGFTQIVEKREKQKQFRNIINKEMGIDIVDDTEEDIQRFSRALTKYIPTLRNNFAHGGNSLIGGYLEIVITFKDIINQLFRI